MNSLVENLNEAQKEAVTSTEGPLLVLAGAGTGKTRVLTTRLAYILSQQKAWPGQILAVTFTNKAAGEMKERIASLIGGPVEGMWLGTFHSLCVRILRQHAEHVGLESNFTILDTDDQLRLVKQILAAERVDEKKTPARAVLAIINRWKDQGLLPEKVQESGGEGSFSHLAHTVYKQYQQRLKTLNAADFGDLILHCLTIFTTAPDILSIYQNKFLYILVDEYQDTNIAQYLWLRLLSQRGAEQDPPNICCVGDDDQSIYGWRGAEVGNILRFERDFPEAKVIRLEENYRSTGHILAAASKLIAHNKGRLGKTLWTSKTEGEKITLKGVWDGEEEARFVADEVEALQRRGTSLENVAVLVRAGFQTREFEDRFLNLGIPYRVIGGPRFYERMEIRDALAYFRCVVQPNDSLAFERIINKPRRGLGDTTVKLLHEHARVSEISLIKAAEELVQTDDLRAAARKSLQTFLTDLARWRSLLEAMEHGELVRVILDESGYTTMWQQSKEVDAPGRLENLKELVSAVDEFGSLPAFLEHISLVMENSQSESEEKVTLMTVHSAKGLEFQTVFLSGWEEGIFPHPRTLDESGLKGLEEERRLAYVALTRARQKVYITFAANRRLHGSWQSTIPSRFIEELPEDHIEMESARGLYGAKRISPSSVSSLPPLKPRALPKSSSKGSLYGIGDRVYHEKFGGGRVLGVEKDRLTINFDSVGPKKIMSSFIKKA